MTSDDFLTRPVISHTRPAIVEVPFSAEDTCTLHRNPQHELNGVPQYLSGMNNIDSIFRMSSNTSTHRCSEFLRQSSISISPSGGLGEPYPALNLKIVDMRS